MILIEKSARRLSVIKRGNTLLVCPVSLGFAPLGHKTAEGDGKTPEGIYRLCTKNVQSKYHISFGLNYPCAKDALSGLKEKRVGLWDAISIIVLNALRLRPRWNTPLGGFVMIHGESPEGKTGDWTQGCAALKNSDIEALARLCGRGEKVVIKQ